LFTTEKLNLVSYINARNSLYRNTPIPSLYTPPPKDDKTAKSKYLHIALLRRRRRAHCLKVPALARKFSIERLFVMHL